MILDYSIIAISEGVFIFLSLIGFGITFQNKTKKIASLEAIIANNEITDARIAEKNNEVSELDKMIEKKRGSLQLSVTEEENQKTKVEQFLKDSQEQENKIKNALNVLIGKYKEIKAQHEKINQETLSLQELKANAETLAKNFEQYKLKEAEIKTQIETLISNKGDIDKEIQERMSRIDLYSRLDEFSSVGHFVEPQYLYETSERFAEEIKRVREKQRDLIKDKNAVTCPELPSITGDDKLDKKIIDGQANLMLSVFNIECDFLIGKVRPSNYTRTLEQIDVIATKLEKYAATLHCGFNTEYVKLKYEECTLQYQYSLKKQNEQEEQRLIREQMKEEAKAQKEYERAIAEAEREEELYRKMLERAKEALGNADAGEKIILAQRIEDLEKQLEEAQQKEERARSLAEQTRKGYVYIISNIGSFGKGTYKIGLTRRLDPLDRVNELGDASVPFRFDVHSIIASDDAPALETALHRKFKDNRLNAVNYRKEFFRVELDQIKQAVMEITNNEADFKMTAIAEEYYESMRLRAN